MYPPIDNFKFLMRSFFGSFSNSKIIQDKIHIHEKAEKDFQCHFNLRIANFYFITYGFFTTDF
jgi:hypothetical protein